MQYANYNMRFKSVLPNAGLTQPMSTEVTPATLSPNATAAWVNVAVLLP
jgi:hypothetical protein